MKTTPDPADDVDTLTAAWRRVRPGLDTRPLEAVGRVIVLAQHLERSAEAALAPHGLSLGQFDILGTLRRQDAGMTPTQLLQRVVLSSGGMTSRLDRLAEAGLVVRHADPGDRRGVIVALTPKGRKVIDAATDARFAKAAASLPPLAPQEVEQLTGLLRRWLLSVETKTAGP